MQSPKEKAKDLYNKFYSESDHFRKDLIRKSRAIECAKVAVNEIISIAHNPRILQFEYWGEVKKELENL